MQILTRIGDLEAFCRRAREHGSLALDTEFERERTYKPILQLLQAATPEEAVIIDPLALSELTPLWDLVADPTVETILHAADQDLEIFYDKTRKIPQAIFDTQVAAALLGMGEQPGYADLIKRTLKVRLKKHERVTDWGRRPLSDAQLQYALDDVVYLHELRNDLHDQLERRGRLTWLREEVMHYESREHYEVDKRRLWLRVSRHRSLDRRGLAVLRELTDWRESCAQRRNIPRSRVLKDDMLIELARRQPKQPDDMRALRRMHPREIERSGEEICEAVRVALELPESEWPKLPPIPDDDPDLNVTADLLGVLLRRLARESSIAASYLATKKDIVRLIARIHDGHGDEDELRLLQGWRYELAGETLVRLLRGEIELAVDAETLRVVVDERKPAR